MIRKCALALFAALSLLQTQARSQSFPTVRVATLPIDVASLALYAKDEGFSRPRLGRREVYVQREIRN